MKAICPQCNMRYEIGADLQKDAAETLCPTCEVALSFDQSDQVSPESDLPDEHDAEQAESKPTTDTTDEASFETPLGDASTKPPVEVKSADETSTEHSGLDQADQSSSVAEKQHTTTELSSISDKQETTEEIETQVEDWAEAAARWATSGFSADQMPEFVKNEKESKISENVDGDALDHQDPADEPTSRQSDQIDEQEPVEEKSSGEETTQKEMLTEDRNQLMSTDTELQIPPPIPNDSDAETDQKPEATENTGAPSRAAQNIYVLQEAGEQTSEETHPWQKPDQVETDHTEPASASTFEIQKETQPEAFDTESPTTQTAQGTNIDLTDTASFMSVKHGKPVLWIALVVIMLAAGCLTAWYLEDLKRFLGMEGSAKVITMTSSNTDRTSEKQKLIDPRATRSGSADQTGHTSDLENQSKPKSDQSIEAGKQKEAKKTTRKNSRLYASRKKKAAANLKRAVLYTKQGYAFIKKKKYSEAVRRFRKALKAHPSYPTSHRGLGICYAQLGRHNQACREYRKYLRMIPPNAKEVRKLKAILKDCK